MQQGLSNHYWLNVIGWTVDEEMQTIGFEGLGYGDITSIVVQRSSKQHKLDLGKYGKFSIMEHGPVLGRSSNDRTEEKLKNIQMCSSEVRPI